MYQELPPQGPEVSPSGEKNCRHRWILPTPSGPMAKGTCKICRVQRDFPNGMVVSKITDPRNRTGIFQGTGEAVQDPDSPSDSERKFYHPLPGRAKRVVGQKYG